MKLRIRQLFFKVNCTILNLSDNYPIVFCYKDRGIKQGLRNIKFTTVYWVISTAPLMLQLVYGKLHGAWRPSDGTPTCQKMFIREE